MFPAPKQKRKVRLGRQPSTPCRADRLPALAAARIGWLLISLWVAGWEPPLQAQEVVNREYTIKGTYLYQFSHYVEWPDGSFANDEAPLVIGVLGHDPFGVTLDQLARTKRIFNRRLDIRRFARLDQYTPCQILFVPRSVDREEQLRAIRYLGGSGVLLVGETPAFARQGGMISFFIQQNRVRFEINRQAAQRGRLKISSKLLSIGRLVEEEKS